MQQVSKSLWILSRIIPQTKLSGFKSPARVKTIFSRIFISGKMPNQMDQNPIIGAQTLVDLLGHLTKLSGFKSPARVKTIFSRIFISGKMPNQMDQNPIIGAQTLVDLLGHLTK